MADNGDYRFTVEVRSRGAGLARAPATVAMCREDVLFRGILTGMIPNVDPLPALRVLPRWESSGPPNVSGLSVMLEDRKLAEYGLEVFAAQAQGIVNGLLAQKEPAAGEPIEWGVLAAAAPSLPASGAKAQSAHAPYPLHETVLPESPLDSFTVRVAAPVIEETSRLFLERQSTESGGVLVGSLLFDPVRRAVALRVTDHIALPAGRGGASHTHFSFDPRTLRSARQLARQRGSEAILAGWFHTHPPCRSCASWQLCNAETLFFSSADFKVHAGAFPAPYMVALVSGKMKNAPANRAGFRLYGWHRGMIVERPTNFETREEKTDGTEGTAIG